MPSPRLDAEITGKGVARSSDAALALIGHRLDPCPYPAHRDTDWRRADSHPTYCGVCHPHAPGVPAIPAIEIRTGWTCAQCGTRQPGHAPAACCHNPVLIRARVQGDTR